MKCCACDCKNEAKYEVKTLWGKESTIMAFCEEHAPEWLKGSKVGDFSPAVRAVWGITKSWYQRIK